MNAFNPFITDEEAVIYSAKGERFRDEADAWIEANPLAWDYMKHAAAMSASQHRRFGVKSLCEHVRWHMAAEGVTSFKLNNNNSAAFARRLIREVPECEPYIKTRSSALDAV